MINLKAIIDTVEGLLAEGTAQGATYAGLECRLAIEKICYDRLKIAHDYISHDDLRRWQPRDIVETLIAEVDAHIASTFTLSMSREPAEPSSAKPPGDEKLASKLVSTPNVLAVYGIHCPTLPFMSLCLGPKAIASQTTAMKARLDGRSKKPCVNFADWLKGIWSPRGLVSRSVFSASVVN